MPTDPAALREAIRRLEAGETGREVDGAVARAVGWHRVEPRFRVGGRRGGWIAPADFRGVHSDGAPILDSLHGTDIHRDPPRYTTSIDAAVTLVPEGWGWNLRDALLIGPLAWCEVWKRRPGPTPGVIKSSEHRSVAEAPTPAAALALAALRARVEMEAGDG